MKATINPFKKICFVAVTLLFISNACYFKHEVDTDEDEENENPGVTIREEYLQEFQRTKDPSTGTVPRERLLEANDQVKQYYSKDFAITGINWVERGPSNVGGRTRAILFDKNDATDNTLFAGGVAGGIWKCTNLSAATPTWTKISDVLDNIAISTIVQDQSTPSIMYFGTGEVWGNVDAQRGLGIWKSADGGASWTHLASTASAQFNYVQSIVLTPYAIFAATGSGLKKSTDGGNSWSSVLINSISDLQMAANGDLYASNFLGNVYKSTNAQQGATGTWANTSLPGSHQRLKLATAPSDANKVYVVCQQAGGSEVDAIYRTDDGGTTWNTCALPTVTDQGTSSTFARGQAWYDLSVAVDPNDASTVIIGAIDALRSTNGGVAWSQITAWALPVTGFTLTVHSDQHVILFSPGSSAIAVWGTDGGMYSTANVNVTGSKPTFKAINTGYNVTQFYGGAINPTSGSNYFLGGAQDNGSQKFPGPGAGVQSTTAASGGDGAFCHIDQTTPANQITSYVYSVYYLSINSGASFINKINDQTHGSFINPTDYDPATKVLYGDYTTVATATGGAYSRWLTTGTTNTGVTVANFSGAIVTNVYISPNVAKRVYFGLANGSVVFVNNASTATTATVTSTIIKTGTGSVSGIAIETGNENHILVTYSNYGVNSVWETTDGGTTWTSDEGNLPDMPVRWVIFNPTNANQAFLATELGVWSTDDLNGASTMWAPTNAGLANTRVDMLKVRTADNTILAATHGRGLFTTTLSNVILPTVYFEKRGVSVAENGGTVDACTLGSTTVPVKLYLSSPATAPVTVQVNVAGNSTATNGADYTIASNTVTFPTGTTGPQTVNVTVNDDNSFEGNEYLNLTYSITAGASVATPGITLQNFELEITDNEVAPTTGYVNIVNSGTSNTSLGGSSPVQGTQTDKKTQYLYQATDLLANGLKAGVITDISFIVSTKASAAPYNGFTFKLGATAATDLSAGFATSAAWTTITSASYSTVFGINQFTIPGGFTWDGTSNILFEFCYDNATASADDIVSGEATSYASQAKNASTTGSSAGCSFTTATLTNTFRPVFTFTQTLPQAVVSNVLNSTKQAKLSSFDKVFYYDASGKIMASIENKTAFDYGCTSVTIDRAGTGATAFTDNTTTNFLANKTFRVIPATNNPAGQYTITLYFTQAEKAGWEAATGNSWNNILLIKTTGAISSATPANPVGAGTIEYATPVRSTFGTDYTLSYTFSTGFSGFGAGVPPSTLALNLLNFTGNLQGNTANLNWTTAFEHNTRYFEIQRSADGISYDSIGQVSPIGNSFISLNYSFSDLRAAPINYYRLKIVDLDGKSIFSSVVLLKSGATKQKVFLLGNPFVNSIDVGFSEVPQSSISLNLYDMEGKKLATKSLSGSFNQVQLDVSKLNLTKGVYLLQVEADRKYYTYKVVKK
jgi:trimeric autotransporter adhesin